MAARLLRWNSADVLKRHKSVSNSQQIGRAGFGSALSISRSTRICDKSRFGEHSKNPLGNVVTNSQEKSLGYGNARFH